MNQYRETLDNIPKTYREWEIKIFEEVFRNGEVGVIKKETRDSEIKYKLFLLSSIPYLIATQGDIKEMRKRGVDATSSGISLMGPVYISTERGTLCLTDRKDWKGIKNSGDIREIWVPRGLPSYHSILPELQLWMANLLSAEEVFYLIPQEQYGHLITQLISDKLPRDTLLQHLERFTDELTSHVKKLAEHIGIKLRLISLEDLDPTIKKVQQTIGIEERSLASYIALHVFPFMENKERTVQIDDFSETGLRVKALRVLRKKLGLSRKKAEKCLAGVYFVMYGSGRGNELFYEDEDMVRIW